MVQVHFYGQRYTSQKILWKAEKHLINYQQGIDLYQWKFYGHLDEQANQLLHNYPEKQQKTYSALMSHKPSPETMVP